MDELKLFQALAAYPAMQSKIAALWGQPECCNYLEYLLDVNNKAFEISVIIALGNMMVLHTALFPQKRR